MALWYTDQSSVEDKFLIIITSGTTPKPWPTVVWLPVPVYLTILKPAVVFAETVEDVAPSEFAEPAELPAFQFQAT